MGKITGVIEKTVHDVMTPLEQIENKKEWPEHIFRQADFAMKALNTDLRTGLAIIENFEKHRAWEYVDQKRESFFDHQVHIDPTNIPAILEGYKLLIGRGEHPTNWRQAMQAVQADKDDRQNQRPANIHIQRDLYNNEKDIQVAPTGTSLKATLRRLRKDRPDIHARVLNGELSANAGMIEAGFRKKKISKKRTALDHLHSWWAKASDSEREIFRKEIS